MSQSSKIEFYIILLLGIFGASFLIHESNSTIYQNTQYSGVTILINDKIKSGEYNKIYKNNFRNRLRDQIYGN